MKRFEIKNPGEGGSFPSILPQEALPNKADAKMLEWHDSALEKLRPDPEVEEARRSTETAEDVESLTDSSVDGKSIIDAGDYFEPRDRHGASSAQPNVIQVSPTARQSNRWYSVQCPSQPDYHRRSRSHETSTRDNLWSRDGPTPTGFVKPRTPRTARPRIPSLPSSTSDSEAAEDEELSLSEASLSPVAVYRQRQEFGARSHYDPHGRRHSTHNPLDAKDYVLSSQHKHPNTLSPPFYAHVRPQSQPGLFKEVSPPQRTDVKWREADYKPSSFYNAPNQTREPPSVRFVDADKAFREERMRRRSNGSGR